MAELPKEIVFKMKASPQSMERLNETLSNARRNLDAVRQSVYEAQAALDDVVFTVERSKPEDVASDDPLPPG